MEAKEPRLEKFHYDFADPVMSWNFDLLYNGKAHPSAESISVTDTQFRITTLLTEASLPLGSDDLRLNWVATLRLYQIIDDKVRGTSYVDLRYSLKLKRVLTELDGSNSEAMMRLTFVYDYEFLGIKKINTPPVSE